jgi:hypothetical protein
MYVPASHDTQNTARLRFSSNSSNFDSWMVRTRSCRLTADIRGGRWKRAPVSVCSARGRAAGLGRLECKRRTQTYSFPIEPENHGQPLATLNILTTIPPALCWDFTSRVARSMQTIKQPVTFGSKVPLCPVFSTRSIRRSQATTSCEDGFEGLSKLITPDL